MNDPNHKTKGTCYTMQMQPKSNILQIKVHL